MAGTTPYPVLVIHIERPTKFKSVAAVGTGMLLRLAAVVLGLLELLRPRTVVDFWMGLATREDDVSLRPWVYTAARIEGIFLVLWAVRRSRSSADGE